MFAVRPLAQDSTFFHNARDFRPGVVYPLPASTPEGRHMTTQSKRRRARNAFFGHWFGAIWHGVGCYSTARTRRHVQLRMVNLPSPAEALKSDFGAVGWDLYQTARSRERRITELLVGQQAAEG